MTWVSEKSVLRGGGKSSRTHAAVSTQSSHQKPLERVALQNKRRARKRPETAVRLQTTALILGPASSWGNAANCSGVSGGGGPMLEGSSRRLTNMLTSDWGRVQDELVLAQCRMRSTRNQRTIRWGRQVDSSPSNMRSRNARPYIISPLPHNPLLMSSQARTMPLLSRRKISHESS